MYDYDAAFGKQHIKLAAYLKQRVAFSTDEDGDLQNLKKQGIDALVVIGGDELYRRLRFSKNTLTYRNGCARNNRQWPYGSTYTGFDTATNTVLAIDKIRDTADAHDRLFFIEVMGRPFYVQGFCGAEAIITRKLQQWRSDR